MIKLPEDKEHCNRLYVIIDSYGSERKKKTGSRRTKYGTSVKKKTETK